MTEKNKTMNQSKPKKKKKSIARNKTKDMLADYYRTNKAYSEENKRRQEEEGVSSKGLKNLNGTEKTYIVIIALGIIGILVKYIFFR